MTWRRVGVVREIVVREMVMRTRVANDLRSFSVEFTELGFSLRRSYTSCSNR